MPSKIISDELKEEIINYYLSKPMTYKEIAIKYNLSNPTIGKILKDIPKYPKAKLYNPNLNENFFENIDSESKAYYLGLLISDGNVFKEDSGRQASISITLDDNDKYILEKFKNELNTNTSINSDGRGCSQIAVRSNKMADDLAKLGIVPRKSYYTYLPNIDKKYMNHLIRGIFDGDGSITAKESHGSSNGYLHAFSFCGSEQLMKDLSEYLFTTLKLHRKPRVYNYKDRKLSEIKIHSINDMYLFGDWMYNNATIYLTRKNNIYNNFKIHYNDKKIPG